MAAARISKGIQKKLFLGNLDAKRDWGHAKDFVEGMWLMLQQDKPDDYVLSTGEMHTVREFAQKAFEVAGINIIWEGSGIDKKGINEKTGEVIIEVDPYYFRPTEVNLLIGDSTKARTKLGWKPRISFNDLIVEMVEHDLKNIK